MNSLDWHQRSDTRCTNERAISTAPALAPLPRPTRSTTKGAYVHGTLVGGQRNFNGVKVEGVSADYLSPPSSHDKSGAELWAQRVAVSELRFKN